jgi:PIN domain nuclease of toxin-antitoxin system
VRALLDTHAFLWAIGDATRLSQLARTIIEDTRNELLFSAASAYEIASKHARGRLELPEPIDTFLPDRLARFALRALPIEIDHAIRAAALPPLHADPWDRILIAQAQAEAIPLLSVDPAIAAYDVEVVW